MPIEPGTVKLQIPKSHFLDGSSLSVAALRLRCGESYAQKATVEIPTRDDQSWEDTGDCPPVARQFGEELIGPTELQMIFEEIPGNVVPITIRIERQLPGSSWTAERAERIAQPTGSKVEVVSSGGAAVIINPVNPS